MTWLSVDVTVLNLLCGLFSFLIVKVVPCLRQLYLLRKMGKK